MKCKQRRIATMLTTFNFIVSFFSLLRSRIRVIIINLNMIVNRCAVKFAIAGCLTDENDSRILNGNEGKTCTIRDAIYIYQREFVIIFRTSAVEFIARKEKLFN